MRASGNEIVLGNNGLCSSRVATSPSDILGLVRSLVLGLVNNCDPVKAVLQRNLVDEIASHLRSAGDEISMVEASQQRLRSDDELGKFGLRWHVLRHTIAQEMHHLREYRRRRQRPTRITVRKRLKVLNRSLESIKDYSGALHIFKRLEVEAAVSRKHLKIWEEVVATGASGAVVFEDDFSFRSGDSIKQVFELLLLADKGLAVIDLAGGLNWEAMGLPPQVRGDLTLDIIVANTACAYFISQTACQALVDLVERRPAVIYLSPDFLISELNNAGFVGSTFLPAKPPLLHGSREGLVESSIPY